MSPGSAAATDVDARGSGLRSRRLTIGVVAVIAAVVLVWWWFPFITRAGEDTDIGIVGGTFLRSAEREVTYRIHEDGFATHWSDAANGAALTWCDAAAAVAAEVRDVDPRTIVLSVDAEGSCGTDPVALRADVAEAAGSADVVVVLDPSQDGSPVPDGARVVTTSRLLGEPGTSTQGCLWFDTCSPDGRVDVRNADGTLAPSGQTRVARLIVTALR